MWGQMTPAVGSTGASNDYVAPARVNATPVTQAPGPSFYQHYNNPAPWSTGRGYFAVGGSPMTTYMPDGYAGYGVPGMSWQNNPAVHKGQSQGQGFPWSSKHYAPYGYFPGGVQIGEGNRTTLIAAALALGVVLWATVYDKRAGRSK